MQHGVVFRNADGCDNGADGSDWRLDDDTQATFLRQQSGAIRSTAGTETGKQTKIILDGSLLTVKQTVRHKEQKCNEKEQLGFKCLFLS